MNDEQLKYLMMLKEFNSELMELNTKYSEEIMDLQNERDILKSKLSETKADICYLLKNGESIYIRNKYIRGDSNE